MKVRQTYIPGSDWIYFKIYTGVQTADMLLYRVLSPIVKKLLKDGCIKKFFFIRYEDPDFHLRIRFLLSDRKYALNVLDSIYKGLAPLVDKKLIWNIQLDTYQRELDRYSPYLIEEVESIFYVDSIYIINLIRLLDKYARDEFRWMISLVLLDSMLSIFNYDIIYRKNIMQHLSQSFRKEFKFDRDKSKLLNIKYESNRKNIEDAFVENSLDSEYRELQMMVNRRAKEMTPYANNILQISYARKLDLDSYVISYLHMTMNRLFRAQNRLYELIIYDFLKRYYMHQLAL